MLDPTFKKNWLNALRSGKYKQTSSVLRDENDHYCCMGVAADIIDPTAWHITPVMYQGSEKRCYVHDRTNMCNLNSASLDKVGLASENQWHLIDMNDRGDSFETIARYIEEKIL